MIVAISPLPPRYFAWVAEHRVCCSFLHVIDPLALVHLGATARMQLIPLVVRRREVELSYNEGQDDPQLDRVRVR